MVVLGIVLIAVAVLLGLGVSVSSSEPTTLEVFGGDLGMSVSAVFFTGVVLGAATVLGVWLLKKGLGRGYRRHKEVRQLRQQAEATPPTSETVASDTDIIAKSTDPSQPPDRPA
jgi:hypothetical protein